LFSYLTQIWQTYNYKQRVFIENVEAN
jgi:hypothetical protein